MYIGFRLDKSVTLSDLEYEGATVGYCQLSRFLVSFVEVNFSASVFNINTSI